MMSNIKEKLAGLELSFGVKKKRKEIILVYRGTGKTIEEQKQDLKDEYGKDYDSLDLIIVRYNAPNSNE